MVTNSVGYTVVHMANITSNNFLIDQEGHEVLSEYCIILIGTFFEKVIQRKGSYKLEVENSFTYFDIPLKIFIIHYISYHGKNRDP